MLLRILPLCAATLAAGCASQSFVDDVDFLRTHTKVVLLGRSVAEARVAVCPELQGRVMTSTAAGPGSRSFGWINRERVASGELRPHINAYGGEDRFWLGPEGGQYSIFFPPGAAFDLEHWQTPAAIDSEPFIVAARNDMSVELRKSIHVVNYSGTVFDLDLERDIRLYERDEIGRFLGALPGEFVHAVGYETQNRVVNKGPDAWRRETGLLSIWILGMFAPSDATTVVVPILEGPDERFGPPVKDDYFGKVPADRIKVTGRHVFFRGDGRLRSKIGVGPRRSKGVLGSWDAEGGVLTIVTFTQPRGIDDYVNSAWELQEEPYRGDASNSYNDGPASPGAKPLGPFYELESSSPALALRPGQSYLHVSRTYHFHGDRSQLDALARHALGLGLDEIEAALR